MPHNVAGLRTDAFRDSLQEPLLTLVQRVRYRVNYTVMFRVMFRVTYWVIPLGIP